MTTAAPTTAPSPASAPGAGPSAEEKTAATGAVALGFALGGPVGGVVMALAIGLEQAFGKSGWDQPSWLGGNKAPALTPEEIQQRHDEAVQRALDYIAGARAQADIRRAAAKQHQDKVREWIESGRNGPKPARPDGRSPLEFLGNFSKASKSWYTLFDDKMAKGNEKITGTYPAIANFFRDLWNFVTGFGEGVKAGWEQYQQEKAQQDTSNGPIRATTEQPLYPQTELPGFDPATPLTAAPPADPAPQPPADPTPPTAPLPPTPEGPAPVAGTGEQGELNSGPTGPGEGTVEGEPMTTQDATALPSGGAVPHMGPQGETNLDLLHQAFAPAAMVLASVTEQVDEIKPLSLAVASRVARIRTLCAVGAPRAVYQMMEEAQALTWVVETDLGEVDLANEIARELTDEALIGLLPAQGDLDTTRGQQASGDIYNRAGH
jgi:hypothetical protein